MANPWDNDTVVVPAKRATVIPQNPYAPNDERRKDEDQANERERLRIAQQQAALAVQNANKPPAGFSWGPPDANGAPTLIAIPGGPADPSLQKGGGKDDGRAAKLAALMAQIDRVESLYSDNFRGGLPNAISGRVPDLIRPETGQFEAAGAGLAEMGLSAFRVPGVGSQSDTELRQFVEANRPLPTDSDLKIEEKLRTLRTRAQAELDRVQGAVSGAGNTPSAWDASNITPPPVAAPSGSNTQSGTIPPEMAAEHEAYMQRTAGNIDPQDYARFRAELAQKYGTGGVSPADAIAYAQAIKDQGITSGFRPLQAGEVPLEGVDKFRNDLVSNPVGAFAASMGNAGGFGIPSLFVGDQMDALRDANPISSTLGEVGGGITGTLIGSAMLGGAASRVANPTIANILANPITADAGYGAVYGATQADDPLYGAVGGATAGIVGNRIGNLAGRALPRIAGVRPAVDPLTGGERAIYDAANRTGIDEVTQALLDASDLNLPATLADVSPDINSLTGAALRRSPAAAGNARPALFDRGRGQYDRLMAAVNRDLGPTLNIPQISDSLISQARRDAAPLYDAAYAAPGADALEIADLLARPSVQQALPRAANLAREEGLSPTTIGFAADGDSLEMPTWQTLDYVKRGLDDVIQDARSANMGALNNEGRLVNSTLQDLLSRMDVANPDYAAARAAYAGPASERAFMERGQQVMGVSPNQLGVDLANITPAQQQQMQLGFQDALATRAGRVRDASNPYEAVLGGPEMRQRLQVMYPGRDEDIARLLMQRDLEGQMAASSNRLVGNSMTAERAIADEAFGESSLGRDLVQGALETAVTGAPVATAVRSGLGSGARRALQDWRTLGIGQRAQALADEIAPITLNMDTQAAVDALTAMQQRDAAHQVIVQELLERAGVRGGHGAAGTSSVIAAELMR